MQSNSEFGKGLTYCLALFIAHKFQPPFGKKNREFIPKELLKDEPWLIINGASDHLYDLQIPNNLPKNIADRLKTLQQLCLEWGHGLQRNIVTAENVDWSFREAKELLRLIDNHLGAETEIAEWE